MTGYKHFSYWLVFNKDQLSQAKPGSEEDCMQQLFRWVSHVLHDWLFSSYFRGITMQIKRRLILFNNKFRRSEKNEKMINMDLSFL